MACRVGMQRRRQGWVEGAPGVRCQLEAKPRRPKAPGPISRDGVAIFAYLAWDKNKYLEKSHIQHISNKSRVYSELLFITAGPM